MMNVRIVRSPPITEIDGVRLDGFQVGLEYDVGNSIGALLLAEGWAEPVALDAPKPIVPFSDNDPYDSRLLYRLRDSSSKPATEDTQPIDEREVAADMFRFRRRPRGRQP
jgi:hypothetical protein